MFEGFSDQTFEFFMAIRFNNNSDFFHQNHDWYERSLRKPMLDLAEALGPTMSKLDPAFDFRPNKCVARINRDIRYARDKSPYRDYLWLTFKRPSGDPSGQLGAYFSISSEGARYGIGIYSANLPLMNALRHKILLEPDGVRKAVAPAEACFALHVNEVKRMKTPDGVPEALKKWYPIRGFYMEKELTDFDLLKSPALPENLARDYLKTAPLYRLVQALVPLDQENDG